MDVKKCSLSVIFEANQQLEAPLFQRPYVWEREKNWAPLWESIVSVADRRLSGQIVHPHFLGTIVLDQVRTPTGSVTTREIIDGQQRLTTLQTALAAIRDLSAEHGADNFRSAFRRLTENDTSLAENPDECFKVWPTNVDRDVFRSVLRAGSCAAVAALGHEDSRGIAGAYLYFHDTVREWLGDASGDGLTARLKTLYDVLRNSIQLVVIDLDANDDAQMIFETLNALGTPLLPADLVKNFLFHRAQSEGADVGALYHNSWEQFDDERSYWRAEIARGRLKATQLDLFLLHYLALKTYDEAPFARLFDTFRRYVRDNPHLSAAAHVNQFRTYADVYRGFSTYPITTPEGRFFSRLEALESSTFLPLLLEVFHRNAPGANSAAVRQVLTDLESFLVRRMVCQLGTKSYGRFVADLIKRLSTAKDFSPDAIRAELLAEKAEASRWPSDDEFRSAWTDLKIYKRLNRARTNMILAALDRGIVDTKGEAYTINGELSIEHLLPQKWDPHWPLPTHRTADGAPVELPTDEAEAWRTDVLHTIGNLTLVTQKLNSSISNGPWEAGETRRHPQTQRPEPKPWVSERRGLGRVRDPSSDGTSLRCRTAGLAPASRTGRHANLSDSWCRGIRKQLTYPARAAPAAGPRSGAPASNRTGPATRRRGAPAARA